MPTILCTRITKVAAQLKSSRMLLALDGEDTEIHCRVQWIERLRVLRSTELHVAPSLNSLHRSFSLLIVQDGELGNSCLPFLSINRLMSAIVGLIVSLNSS